MTWRWVARLPIPLYRARLGWVLGHRFLLLTHRGHRTGRVRDTVLEVVHHAPDTGVYVVAAGGGERTAWLRNVQHQPEVRVTVGTRRLAARATRLTHAEAATVLLGHARAHPLAFAVLTRLLTGRRVRPTPEACAALARQVPLVGLRTRVTGRLGVAERRARRAVVARQRRAGGCVGPLPA